jgi:hypothetical protein
MDVPTIDQEYQQLQNQAQETIGKMQTLADKLRAANLAGNQDAREWMLDLKEITLAIQSEQNQVNALLQALHGFVMRQAEQVSAAPQTAPSPWAGPPQTAPGGGPGSYYAQQPAGGFGGMFGDLMNSGFGRAAAAGAGFGIGDTVISRLFGGRGGC